MQTNTETNAAAGAARKTGKTADSRLEQTARVAISEADGSLIAAIDLFAVELRSAPELLFPLISEEEISRRTKDYLTKIAAKMRGEVTVRSYVRRSPNVNADGIMPAAEEDGGQARRDDRTDTAPSSSTMPGRCTRGAEAIAASMGTVARSILDTFLVNGQPLRKASVREAWSVADKNERDARFLRLLTSGLQDPDAVIGDFVKDDDAARAWSLATKNAA